MKNKNVPGVCRKCGCTEVTPCLHPDHGPCSWATPTLCTHCQDYPGESVKMRDIILVTRAMMQVRERLLDVLAPVINET